jgi:2-C-methyl-D-erythritol 2,4-cyclodiphosphate synthase
VRVGFGYDAHRLVEGRRLILAGVDVPHERGLEGFSDADVAAHAVIDAVLGAAAMGDCGAHFPAGDPRFAGASSTALLREAVRMVGDIGLVVGNVDCTIVVELPPLITHLPAMRKALADALCVDVTRVSVKAKRSEGLGFAGDGSGIEAFATALLDDAT